MNLFDRGKDLSNAHARVVASLLQLDALTRSAVPVEPTTFTSCYGHIATYLTQVGEILQDVSRLQQSQVPAPEQGKQEGGL